MESKEIIQIVAKTCDEKQAEDIIALDMHEVSLVADYFLICHGSNERQIQSIAKAVKDVMEEKGIIIKQMEGLESARWIIVDVDGVLCHIFHKDERAYYNLERLWGDAARIPLGISQKS